MSTPRHYQHIVARFDVMARATLSQPRSIPEICQALAINQRTLARAFRAVRGTTALRHLHALRLIEARKMLLDDKPTNVTSVALRFGFREFGRFAAQYRAAFGETPSQTLRTKFATRRPDSDTGVRAAH